MKVTIDIPQAEVRGLLRSVKAWELRKQGQIQTLIAETALKVERDAKRLAPVDTGRLRASIHSDLSEIAQMAATVEAATDYAAFVELGTSRMSARPYLRPAYEAAMPGFIEELKRILGTP